MTKLITFSIITFSLFISCITNSKNSDNIEVDPPSHIVATYQNDTKDFYIYWEGYNEGEYNFVLERRSALGTLSYIDVGSDLKYYDTVKADQFYDPNNYEFAYKYRVAIVNTNGDTGYWSHEASAKYPKPTAITNIKVDSLFKMIRLSWNGTLDVAPEFNCYKVYSRFELFGNSFGSGEQTDSTFFNCSAEYSSTYNYMVTVVENGVESDLPNDYITVSLGGPPVVQSVSFVDDTLLHKIQVVWSYDSLTSGAETHFSYGLSKTELNNTYHSFSSDNPYIFRKVSDTSVNINLILPSVAYYGLFSSEIKGDTNFSLDTLVFSYGDIVDTITEQAAITKVRLYIHGGALEINWAFIPGATEYRVYRSESLTGEYVAISDWIIPTFPYDNNQLGSSAETGTYFYFDKSSNTDKIYFYKVEGRNLISVGPLSSSYYGRVNNPYSSYKAPVVTNVNSSETIDNSIMLSWEDPGNVIGFRIYRDTVSPRSSSAVDVSGLLDTLSWTDTTAIPGNTYYYWIQSVDINNDYSKYTEYPESLIVADTNVNTTYLAITVYDSCSLEILEGARVELMGTSLFAITDSSGNAIFDAIAVPPTDTIRECTLSISFSGYETITKIASAKMDIYNYAFSHIMPTAGCSNDTVMSIILEDTSSKTLDLFVIVPDTNGSATLGWITGNLLRSPYAILDTANGYEHVILSKLYSGTYKVYVRNYSVPAGEFKDTNAKIVIRDDSGVAISTISVGSLSGSGNFWYVCDIDGSTGNVTNVQSIQSTEPE